MISIPKRQSIFSMLCISVIALLLTACSVKLEQSKDYGVKDKFLVISDDGRSVMLGPGDILTYSGPAGDECKFTLVIAKKRDAKEQEINRLNSKLDLNIDMSVSTRIGDKFTLPQKQVNKYLKRSYDNELLQAVKDDKFEIARELVGKGANMNIVDQNGFSCITIAVVKENIEFVEYLISKGAKVNSYSGYSPLSMACKSGNLEMVKLLVDNKASLYQTTALNTPLEDAAEEGHLEIVKFLMDNGAKIDPPKVNPLSLAAQRGHLDVVKYLVEQGAEVVIENFDPTVAAAKRGHVKVVKYLESKGGKVNYDQVLVDIIKSGNAEMFAYAIEKGARYLDENELLIAVEIGDTVMFNKAIARKDELLNADRVKKYSHITPKKFIDKKSPWGQEPAINIACRKNRYDMAKELIESGAELYILGKYDITPIKAAVQSGNLEMVKLIVENEGYFERKYSKSKTAIEMANEYRYPEIAAYLNTQTPK